MTAPVVSREYRIYLALWRKAVNSSEEIKINCSSRNMAISMRQGMYRAVRPFRRGEASDSILRQAAEKFVVYLEPGVIEGPCQLIIKERKALAELETLWDDLGLSEEDLLLGEERMLHEELTELIETPTIERAQTPFYKREE